MITQSLATKHRPCTWDDVIGQDESVNRLKNIIKSEKIPNAFLFIGDTGTGKTTLSRVLAAYLSCSSEKEVKKFNSKNHPDIIEVNAGADGKKEDIEQLINSARFKPQRSKYKIICIDEAQSVLTAAKNALLKPLEEPPAHTIYILSSMNPEKLDNALINRCSVFKLNSLTEKDLIKTILNVGEKEKFKWLDKTIASKISEYADGSARQAISNLEAVAQSVGDSKKAKNIDSILEKILGSSETISATDILAALYGQNLCKLNKAILESDNLLMTINKLSYLNLYIIDKILDCNSKKVAHWGENKEAYENVKKYLDKKSIKVALQIQDTINNTKLKMGTFMSNDRSIVLSDFAKLITYWKG